MDFNDVLMRCFLRLGCLIGQSSGLSRALDGLLVRPLQMNSEWNP